MKKSYYLYIVYEIMFIVLFDLNMFNQVFHMGIPLLLSNLAYSYIPIFLLIGKSDRDRKNGDCYYGKIKIFIYFLGATLLGLIKRSIITAAELPLKNILIYLCVIYAVQIVYSVVNNKIFNRCDSSKSIIDKDIDNQTKLPD